MALAEQVSIADNPFYWDHLQYTTEAILEHEPWIEGKDHELRIAYAHQSNDGAATFILQETRVSEYQPSELSLDYQLCQTYATEPQALTARHRLHFDVARKGILSAHQLIKGRAMSDELRAQHPTFFIPSHTERTVPVRPSDYKLLSDGLTRIRRLAGIH